MVKTTLFIAVWSKDGAIKGIKIDSNFNRLTDYFDHLFANPLTRKDYEARIFNQDEQEIAKYSDEEFKLEEEREDDDDEDDDDEDDDEDENTYVNDDDDDDDEFFYRD